MIYKTRNRSADMNKLFQLSMRRALLHTTEFTVKTVRREFAFSSALKFIGETASLA